MWQQSMVVFISLLNILKTFQVKFSHKKMWIAVECYHKIIYLNSDLSELDTFLVIKIFFGVINELKASGPSFPFMCLIGEKLQKILLLTYHIFLYVCQFLELSQLQYYLQGAKFWLKRSYKWCIVAPNLNYALPHIQITFNCLFIENKLHRKIIECNGWIFISKNIM